MRVTASVIIDQPIREIFAYVANPSCWPGWMTGVRATERRWARSLDVGDTFDRIDRRAAHGLRSTWEVTEYEPPRVLCCRRITSGNPALLHQVFESIDGSTRLTVSLEGEETGLVTSGPESERAMTVQITGDLHRLKDLVEDRITEVNTETRGLTGGQDAGA